MTDLALTCRPFSFGEMVGQKTIIAEMKKRSVSRDWPSVMIFAGDSGTGKTTLALIVGALMNDDVPLKRDGYFDPNPESEESKSVLNEVYNRNVSFYDASKMGKDDVIALEEVVSSVSFFGGRKVIIIDEAQELSRHSKGVTLKLLERKREGVCIILCTMNPESFDKSVRSRGQFYQFKSPSSADIAANLFELSEKTGVTLPDEFLQGGIFTIAENCEGSVRMAVQILERCLTSELYTEEAIQNEFGFIQSSKLGEIIKRLLTRKKEAFADIKTFDLKDFFYQSNKFISDCVIYLRTGLVDAEWKANQYDALRQFSLDLSELFDLYSEIDLKMGSYFKPSYCMVRLTEFLQSNVQAKSEVICNTVREQMPPQDKPRFKPLGTTDGQTLRR